MDKSYSPDFKRVFGFDGKDAIHFSYPNDLYSDIEKNKPLLFGVAWYMSLYGEDLDYRNWHYEVGSFEYVFGCFITMEGRHIYGLYILDEKGDKPVAMISTVTISKEVASHFGYLNQEKDLEYRKLTSVVQIAYPSVSPVDFSMRGLDI